MPWPQHFICCMPCIIPFMPLPPVPMPIIPPSSVPMPILSDTDGLSATGGVEGFTDESCARTAEPTAMLATATNAATATSSPLLTSFGCFFFTDHTPLISSLLHHPD